MLFRSEWGMSDKLGRVRYGANEQEVFLGHSVTQSKNLSEDTAKLIDLETRNLIQVGEAKAKKILTKYRTGLHAVANALLEYETLSGEEVKKVLAGEKLNRDEPPKSRPTTNTPSVPRTGKRAGGLEPQTQA